MRRGLTVRIKMSSETAWTGHMTVPVFSCQAAIIRGKLFHTLVAAAANVLSPKLLQVRLTASVRVYNYYIPLTESDMRLTELRHCQWSSPFIQGYLSFFSENKCSLRFQSPTGSPGDLRKLSLYLNYSIITYEVNDNGRTAITVHLLSCWTKIKRTVIRCWARRDKLAISFLFCAGDWPTIVTNRLLLSVYVKCFGIVSCVRD